MDQNRFIFWMAFLLCAAASLLPIWSVKYLPMTDLPQFAAQVSIVKNYSSPAFGFQEYYSINWLTPYILGVFLSVVFSKWMGIIGGIKITLSLIAVGFPLSLLLLLRTLESDDWWCLLGFPFLFGFAFYWGLINYLMAVPIAVLMLAAFIRFHHAPTGRRGLYIAGLGVLLFLSHLFAFGLTIIACLLFTWTSSGSMVEKFKKSIPFLLFLPLTAIWIQQPEVVAFKPARLFSFSGFVDRLLSGPALFLSTELRLLETSMALFFFALFVASGVRIEKKIPYWTPFCLAFLIYLFYPQFLVEYAVPERTILFLIPFLFLGLRPKRNPIFKPLARGGLIFLILFWGVFLTGRFLKFDRLARGIEPVIDAIPQNSRVLGLIIDKRSEGFPGVPWLHFPAWIQVFKGGYYQYSFAAGRSHNVAVEKWSSVAPVHFELLSWKPRTFSLRRHGIFDIIVFRSVRPPLEILPPAESAGLRVISHSDEWWITRPK